MRLPSRPKRRLPGDNVNKTLYIPLCGTDAVNDSPEVMAYFKTNPSVDDILRKSDFWGMDLTTIPGFADTVKSAL